jgi:hypothetical protein
MCCRGGWRRVDDLENDVNFVTSWRALLWSVVAALSANRSYTTSKDCLEMADKILAGYDERFTSDGYQLFERKKEER